jgi:hypothetical protein
MGLDATLEVLTSAVRSMLQRWREDGALSAGALLVVLWIADQAGVHSEMLEANVRVAPTPATAACRDEGSVE